MTGLETRELTYRAGDAEVPARLHVPAGLDEPAPGVLLCPGRLRNIDGLAFLTSAFVAAGRIVLAIRYRGMGFLTDDEDARAALDLLAADERVDAGRLAGVGHSRGGMCVLRTAARDERLRAVVALQPPTDFERYVHAMELLSPVRHRMMLDAMGGGPEEVPDRYAAISALHYGPEIAVPTLLVAGTQDLHAPLDHSEWMRDAIGERADCELVVLDDVGHFFERMYDGYAFDEVAALADAWLRRHLDG